MGFAISSWFFERVELGCRVSVVGIVTALQAGKRFFHFSAKCPH
jgi:hypothetical protein